MSLSKVLFAACLATVQSLRTSPEDDIINSLPGLTWDTNYNQYSGFLNLDNGHHLHYWFVESQNDPSTDPVTLWLNGGPGCSSLDGLVYENGPFHLNHTGNLYKNDYAWNLYSNVLYIEAPIGVGFSYSDDGKYKMTDNTTADDNYNALLKFFEAYSDYASNDFYVTGESYGGVYVPTLVLRILQGNENNEGATINLKGFAVGNGVTNDDYLGDSSVWFAYFHGLINDVAWESLLSNCCHSPYTRETCKFSETSDAPDTVRCDVDVEKVNNIIYGGALNWYNIYGTCFTTVEEIIENGLQNDYQKYFREREWILNNKPQTFDFDSHLQNLGESVPCIDSTGADIYLNRDDVKEAIHVNNVTREWSICSGILRYESLYSNLAPVYQAIFGKDSNIYAVVYNGDTDLACNFLGDEWFVEDLNFTALNSYREWFVDATQSYNNQQVAGWTIDYDRVSFVTVRGSGHMVPQYRPEAALKMFQYFLNNENL